MRRLCAMQAHTRYLSPYMRQMFVAIVNEKASPLGFIAQALLRSESGFHDPGIPTALYRACTQNTQQSCSYFVFSSHFQHFLPIFIPSLCFSCFLVNCNCLCSRNILKLRTYGWLIIQVHEMLSPPPAEARELDLWLKGLWSESLTGNELP